MKVVMVCPNCKKAVLADSRDNAKCPDCSSTVLSYSGYIDSSWNNLSEEEQNACVEKVLGKKPNNNSANNNFTVSKSSHSTERESISPSTVMMLTTDSIPGYSISKYCGIVSSAAIYTIGGLIGEGLSSGGQNRQFSYAVGRAENELKNQASAMGANAVIGIQQATTGAAASQVIITLIGTAVWLEQSK